MQLGKGFTIESVELLGRVIVTQASFFGFDWGQLHVSAFTRGNHTRKQCRWLLWIHSI